MFTLSASTSTGQLLFNKVCLGCQNSLHVVQQAAEILVDQHPLQVRAYAPEVLVLSPCGASLESGVQQTCELAALPGWWALPAVRNGRVFVVDHSLFSRPGPR